MVIDGNNNLYITDAVANKIKKITPAGVVTTFAGSGTSARVDGTGTGASFVGAGRLAIDNTNGCIYVHDQNSIRKVTLSGAVVTTFAGNGQDGTTNGNGTNARIAPTGGMAVDESGNLYVGDNYSRIRKITPSGDVSDFSGTGVSGFSDGAALTRARMTYATSIVYSKIVPGPGQIGFYFFDQQNNRIRIIYIDLGAQNFGLGPIYGTYAGSGVSGNTNGIATAATFSSNVVNMALDASRNLYTCEAGSSQKIRKIFVNGGYTISPALPTGLNFNSATGSIGGRPTQATGAVTYTITGTNASGSSSVNITITCGDDNNANLAGLSLSTGTLSPAFGVNTTAYTATVPNTSSSITVTPTKSYAFALTEVRVNGGAYTPVTSGTASGALALNVGSNTINVRVTAQDGTTIKTYTTTVTRAPSTNANLSNLTVSSDVLSPAFATATTAYSAVANSITSVTVTPTQADAASTIQVRVNGGSYSNVTSGSASGALALNLGNNPIDVKVTAQDGTTIKIYTITVIRCVPNTPSVVISNPLSGVCTGGMTTFNATGTNQGNAPIYQWSKNGNSVGSGASIGFAAGSLVNGDIISCVLTSNNACQTTNTATSNNIVVTVIPSPPIGVSIGGTICSIGGTLTVTNTNTINGGIWTSSDPSVVTVVNGGAFASAVTTAVSNGTAVLTYTKTAANGCVLAASCNVLVVPVPTPVLQSPPSYVCRTTSVQLITNTPGGVWTSLTNRASIDSVTGVITGLNIGTANIKYTITNAAGCIGVATYTPAITASPIMVNPAITTAPNPICRNVSRTLVGTPAGGVWSSLNNRATIDPTTGVMTGANAGIASIQYTTSDVAGCTKFVSYTPIVNDIPSVPNIALAVGSPNPQAGAGTGSVCANRTFTLVGSPTPGTWSRTTVGNLTVNATSGVVNTGSIAGASSITYTQSNTDGCSNSKTISADVFICAVRGVNNSNNQDVKTNEFTMYPNPAKSIFNVNVKTLVGAGSIVVTDLYGKQVKVQALSMGNNTVDITNLAKGIYFVSSVTSEGKTTKKLVVE
jgi:hypothetical protein